MKTLVWLIGKPGAGKTTVGDALVDEAAVIHFSYGQLLKEVQPNPPAEGYSPEDREKVNEIIMRASEAHLLIIVDGNPYSKTAFGFVGAMRPHFSQIRVVHLTIDDAAALARLDARGREVLAHDGASERDRIESFNTKLLPLIKESHEEYDIRDIDVTGKTAGEVVEAVRAII